MNHAFSLVVLKKRMQGKRAAALADGPGGTGLGAVHDRGVADRRLMRLGRNCPDLETPLFFHADEIKGAYLLAKKARPASAPTLNQMIRLIG